LRLNSLDIKSFILSPNGKSVVVQHSPYFLIVYDLETHRELWTEMAGELFHYAFHSRGYLLATLEQTMFEEIVINLRSLTSQDVKLCTKAFRSDNPPRKLIFIPPQCLRVLFANGKIHTYDIKNNSWIGQPVSVLDVSRARDKTRIMFNSHGSLIIVPFGGLSPSITISDAVTGLRIKELIHPKVDGTMLAFTEDSTLLAANLRDNEGIAVWDVGTASLKTVIRMPIQSRNPTKINHIAFLDHVLFFDKVERGSLGVGSLNCDGNLPPNSTEFKSIPVLLPRSSSVIKLRFFHSSNTLTLVVVNHRKKFFKDDVDMMFFKPS
jgi:WD40 repeat protein